MSDSDGDEFQKQLDRLTKLEAHVKESSEITTPTKDRIDHNTIKSENVDIDIAAKKPLQDPAEDKQADNKCDNSNSESVNDNLSRDDCNSENGNCSNKDVVSEVEKEVDDTQSENGNRSNKDIVSEVEKEVGDSQSEDGKKTEDSKNEINSKDDDSETNENSQKLSKASNTDSGKDSESETYDEWSLRKRNGGPRMRVTRNATGSLPKGPKTLLMETTEVFDPKKTKKRPANRPGYFHVIAPECTACGSDVILRPYQRRMLIHPYLKTVICRQCHEFYHSDAFGIDDEGSQIYCVWCGEGGELIYCEKCDKAFCTQCIKRNFGRKVKEKILSDNNWECFLCNNTHTADLQKIAGMVVKYQNLCIRDPYLIEKFECEVTKAEMQKEDYQSLVSTKIRERNSAILLSSSQQKEESKRESANSENINNQTSDERDSDKNSKESSSGSDFSVSKSKNQKKIKHNPSKENANGHATKSSTSSDSDDDKFLQIIRKRATNPKEVSKNDKSGNKESKNLVPDEAKTKNGTKEESSDDSLFDTGDTKIKAKIFRKGIESSEGNEEDDSDEQDELVQKYKDKLSKFKEISDKESIHSNLSSNSNSSEDVKSSNESSSMSDNMNSASETDKKKAKKTKNGKEKSGDSENKSSISSSNDEKDSDLKKKQKDKKKDKDQLTTSGTDDTKNDKASSKKKRKRKRKKHETSDSESGSDKDENKDKKKSKRGKRKKIRKILVQNQLQKETIAAQNEEDKRRQKIQEKLLPSQKGKILNFILEDLRKEKDRSKPPTIDDEEKGKVIEVHSHLKKRLKPHQLDGIQFMYDCCIQSVDKVKAGSPGSGCILAHCMGLGKTFQVITFVTTVLNYHYLFGFKKVLVVCPLNTIRNWKVEFDKWLKNIDDAPEVSILTDNISSNEKRAEVIEDWYSSSGVLIVGYTMYRILAQGNTIKKKRLKELFKKCLVDPGPDIVVCDEGHVIKNEKTGISKSLNSIITKRRVILTGTPLQNNLVEYHCMVSFVKPSLLGTTKEFKNMYENPINNGQCVDATEFDQKVMKERSHILYEHLSGCVQRRDYNVLKEFLPKKFEYVLSIKLSDLQIKLYQKFLDKVKARGKAMSKLFECYQTLKKVWTHPWLLEIDAMKNERDSIEDFVTDRDTSEESWDPSSEDSDFGNKTKKKKDHKKNKDGSEKDNKKQPEKNSDVEEIGETENSKIITDIADTIIPDMGGIDYNWFKGDISDKDEKMLEHSGKLLVTLEILDKASQKGDKVLLFSQSLLALDFLETTINRVGWLKGRDYFRMDGSTKTMHREQYQKKFNDKSNKRCRLFLISTKAGGLGINLVAANRIILFDMSWNPSDDTQSLFRAYRYGQTKDVYVYRLVARGTMEEKIYDRQVFKESLSSRVVDEKQITRYFSANDLQELFTFDPSAQTCTTSVLANHNPPADDVLASILVDLDPPLVLEYHEHDSLLEHRPDQQLTEEERKAAWENFKQDKERRDVVRAPMGQQSVFQRLAAHTQMYAGPIITPIYSNQQELILGGFSNEQIVSIQQQLEPVVQAGRLQVKALGAGRLHIQGLGPDQQQVFINSIKEQQVQQIHAAQIARVLPQQHIINQLPPGERAIFEQRLALLVQQQQQAQQLAATSQQPAQPVLSKPATAQPPQPLTIRSEPSGNPITVPDSPGAR